MIPDYWQQFVIANQINEKYFEIDEESDLSGLGGDLRIMTAEQSEDEAKNSYPGIQAARKHYVPVAMCMLGSGDYYYINSNDGNNGPLYRIYHDSVEDDEIEENGIEKVLDNYDDLLEYQHP